MKLDTGMSFRATVLWRRFFAVPFLALIATNVAQAQLLTSPVAFANEDGVVVSFVAAPSLGSTSGGGGGDATQWLKVEFHYGTTANLKTPFLDAIQFKVWIEGRDMQAVNPNAPGQGVAVGLTGTVNYVNVPAGKDIYGVVFVPPSTLARYSTEHGVTDFEKTFDVHVEAYVGGQKMDYNDKNKETDPNWFTQLKAIPGLVFRQDQSPFIVSDTDRYPPLKLPDAAQ